MPLFCRLIALEAPPPSRTETARLPGANEWHSITSIAPAHNFEFESLQCYVVGGKSGCPEANGSQVCVLFVCVCTRTHARLCCVYLGRRVMVNGATLVTSSGYLAAGPHYRWAAAEGKRK